MSIYVLTNKIIYIYVHINIHIYINFHINVNKFSKQIKLRIKGQISHTREYESCFQFYLQVIVS